MSRGPQKIRQRDIAKVVRATVAAGLEVHAVEVDADGKIIVTAGKVGREPQIPNEWDTIK
jgi:hypothetical protein